MLTWSRPTGLQQVSGGAYGGNSHDSHQVQWALPLAALFDVRVMVGNLFQTLCYRSVIICTLFLSCNSPNSMDQW